MSVGIVTGLPGPAAAAETKTGSGNFLNELGNAISKGINSVNQLQHEADNLALLLAMGELDDLHQLTIAAEKADIALLTAVQIRNKVVEAYQEIARMQI